MIIGKARRQLEYEPRKVEKWGSRRKRVDRIVVDNDSSVVVVRWGGRKVKPVRKRRWMTR
jgi:hypothetical protein